MVKERPPFDAVVSFVERAAFVDLSHSPTGRELFFDGVNGCEDLGSDLVRDLKRRARAQAGGKRACYSVPNGVCDAIAADGNLHAIKTDNAAENDCAVSGEGR